MVNRDTWMLMDSADDLYLFRRHHRTTKAAKIALARMGIRTPNVVE
jgi:hypothetical protein